MKFPNSPHAEGWMSHIENAQSSPTPGAATAGVSRAKPKIGIGPKGPGRRLSASELRFDTATPAAAAAGIPEATAMPGATIRPTASASGTSSASLPRRSSSSLPWVIGAGVGVVLIVGAVVMSRHTSSTTAPDNAAVVVGQADTQPKAAPSAEDAQLAAAPSGAGPDSTPASTQTAAAEAAAATPAPAAEPATKVAEAPPAPMFTKTTPAGNANATANATPTVTAKAETPALQPKAVAKADAPREPVVRTLAAPTDTVAQATPPAATLTDATTAAQATQPATPPVTAGTAADAQQAAQPTPSVATANANPAATTATVPAAAIPADATATPPVAQASPAPVPAAAEDAGITVKVRSALVADAVLSGVPISVTTNNGVVKLEGQAPDAQAREHATAVVASTTGVKGVDNRLTVPPVAQLQLSPASQGS